jgi:hypothetical protein
MYCTVLSMSLKMSRKLVDREEEGKQIAQTSGAISMINESNYIVRSTSNNNTYSVTVTKSDWTCSCPVRQSIDIRVLKWKNKKNVLGLLN